MALMPAVMMEKYPKSVIDLFILVLECDGDGAALSNAINAASLALCDADIEMFDLVASSSVTLIGDDKILVDANSQEEDLRSGTIVLSVMPSIDQVSHVLHQGTVDSSLAISAFEKCLEKLTILRNFVPMKGKDNLLLLNFY